MTRRYRRISNVRPGGLLRQALEAIEKMQKKLEASSGLAVSRLPYCMVPTAGGIKILSNTGTCWLGEGMRSRACLSIAGTPAFREDPALPGWVMPSPHGAGSWRTSTNSMPVSSGFRGERLESMDPQRRALVGSQLGGH